MKYFGGCDVGSTYAKCVILDENGKMVADATVRSKINPVQSAELALGEAIGKVDDINSAYYKKERFYRTSDNHHKLQHLLQQTEAGKHRQGHHNFQLHQDKAE
jgi:activator of 2-hydroxyglutaryl-CoA dehydratase